MSWMNFYTRWMPQVGRLKFIAAFESVMFKVFVSDFLLLFSDFIKNISSKALREMAEICKYFQAEKTLSTDLLLRNLLNLMRICWNFIYFDFSVFPLRIQNEALKLKMGELSPQLEIFGSEIWKQLQMMW